MASLRFSLVVLFLSAFLLASGAPAPRLGTADIPSTAITTQPDEGGGGTEQVVKTWLAGPDFRGTFSIILNCVLTLFLCVWTTVHVNIEPNHEEELPKEPTRTDIVLAKIDAILCMRNVRKIGWSIVSLMAPEITMTIAAYERKTAWLLRKEMRRLMPPAATDNPSPNDGQTPSESPVSVNADTVMHSPQQLQNDGTEGSGEGKVPGKDKTPNFEVSKDWDDLTLSYYALMGGFRVVYKGNKDKKTDYQLQHGFLTGIYHGRGPKKAKFDWTKLQVPSGTLTPHGVLWMAEKKWLPPVSPSYIKDKSKVNLLAKVIVCFQAGWMMLQVIARAGAREEVTLAELHTVLHTVCAATMYITWWYKPVDIDLPTEIELTEEQYKELKLVTADSGAKRPNPTNPLSRGNLAENVVPPGQPRLEPIVGTPDNKYLTSRAGLGKLMYQQLSMEKNIFTDVQELGEAYGRIVAARMNLWKEGTFLMVVGLIYGGAHLVAWMNHYPSALEMWLWRGCSIATAFGVCVFVLELVLGAAIKHLVENLENKRRTSSRSKNDPSTEEKGEVLSEAAAVADNEIMSAGPSVTRRAEQGQAVRPGTRTTSTSSHQNPSSVDSRDGAEDFAWKLYKLFVGTTFALGVLIVVFARSFLLVESFLSLRSLPVGAYASVNWVEAFPHVG
ncbi:hypothetical protein FN846DRAFT_323056 [Sphaerosporella brunnea]|uniref:Uncharacterized protein n=1 Tax=Sphaerosporella brunnea TaxID=1250544 RepID=A0A5J5F695_9PEZI|nr:hypothetical protein FN846DRAFT_323056 [Sphaerosporella brunnea]